MYRQACLDYHLSVRQDKISKLYMTRFSCLIYRQILVLNFLLEWIQDAWVYLINRLAKMYGLTDFFIIYFDNNNNAINIPRL